MDEHGPPANNIYQRETFKSNDSGTMAEKDSGRSLYEYYGVIALRSNFLNNRG